jgi:hypothetical protein
VLLAFLAHEEGLHVGARGEGGAGDRVGAHRQPADRGGAVLGCRRGDKLAHRPEPGRPQRGAFRVDVIVGFEPARERDPPDHEGVLTQLGDEPFAGIAHVDIWTVLG